MLGNFTPTFDISSKIVGKLQFQDQGNADLPISLQNAVWACDSHIFIVQGESKTLTCFLDNSMQYQISIDCEIDHFVILEGCNLAILSDRLGTIHFFNVLSGEIMQSQNISSPAPLKEDGSFQKTVVALTCVKGENWNLLIVLWNGRALRLEFPRIVFHETSGHDELEMVIHSSSI